MVDRISEGKAKQELGIAGLNVSDGSIRGDEFLRDLRGHKAIEKFREMRDNDSTIGAVMYATEQVLRDVPYEVKPADDSEAARKEAEFIEQVLVDMEHTLDDHISESLSNLSFGFSLFEVVYKRREGPKNTNPKKMSKFTDGRLGVRKIASRAQWTIDRFDVDNKTGDVLGVYQRRNYGISADNYIPSSKMIHYRTTTSNCDPSGRSILRNAYKAYTFLSKLENVEAIAIERELHGIPIGRIPAEYLASDASAGQIALKNKFEGILRDLKNNEQGYALLPSDVYVDQDGKPTEQRLMDIELITSNGTRNIDIDPVIRRYQHDIARSVMAEFLMLGSGSNGSYALSKSKTDLFLRALESYINSIYDTLNKQLVEPLWRLNGLNFDLMPTIVPGDVAPHDLHELGSYLRNLNGADISLADQPDIVDALLSTAELPNLDREIYEGSRDFERQSAMARNDYYDGPDGIPSDTNAPKPKSTSGQEN